MSSHDMPQLLRPTEAARLLSVAPRTLRHWTRLGKLPHIRVGRLVFYPKDALARWVTAQIRGGDTPAEATG